MYSVIDDLQVYLCLIKLAFKRRTIYKVSSYLNILSSVITLLVQISLWTVLYENTKSTQFIGLKEMYLYIIATLIIMSITKSTMSDKLGQRIRTGEVMMDLLKPIKFKYRIFSEELGENLFRTIFNVIPLCIIGVLYLEIKLNFTLIQIIFFVLCLMMGIILVYNINYLISIFIFWLKESWFIKWFIDAFIRLFGGTVVPLWFYPKYLNSLSNFLPFKLISFEPINILIKEFSVIYSLKILLQQAIWIIVFIIIINIIWGKVISKIEIQGG